MDPSIRAASTGLKNFGCNKIRLKDQKLYLDNKPGVLILPAGMTLQEVLEWNGKEYTAIVMAGGITQEIVKNTKVLTVSLEETPIANVCAGIGMNLEEEGVPHESVEVRNEDDNAVEKARKLLHIAVSGMAYSANERLDQTFKFFDKEKDRQVIKNLKELLDDFAKTTKWSVIHPCFKTCTKPVRLITFSDHDAREGHPAPDPLLLLIRAAIIWSWRYGQKLLVVASKEYHPGDSDIVSDGVSGVDSDDDGESDNELDELATEQFLEYLTALQRPPDSLEELAHRLGQPNGYQGEARESAEGSAVNQPFRDEPYWLAYWATLPNGCRSDSSSPELKP